MRARVVLTRLWLLSSLIGFSLAMTSWMDAEDLTNFVSRPELKVPRLLLKKNHPDLISPGYIFTAPYIKADAEVFTKYYQPCQIGPHIYNLDGELVWSGACIFSNRNAYDFKLNRDGGNATTLSVILGPMLIQPGMKGLGAILGPNLEAEREVKTTSDLQGAYMHEFSVFDGGNTALYIHAEFREVNVTQVTKGNQTRWMVRDEGFREIDLRTNEIRFKWWAMDHIPIEETFDRPPLKDGPNFDVYHINSLERTAFGHYILSMRHTNTIYMISGLDGHVMWRLGGAKSSFAHLNSFNFSAQHDARIQSEHSNGTIVMSFFDNAGATGRPRRHWTAKASSVVVVELDTAADPMTVRPIRRHVRPDKGMTVLRGNAQILPNGNALAGWSSGGYFSEFAEDGTLVMEGNLASNRMSTYRTYKFGIDEVKLFPAEPIALECRTLQLQDGSQATKLSIMYVSWNGATEVKKWKFAVAEDKDVDEARFTVIGWKDKQGFETVAQFNQAGVFALVYALDRDDQVLGNSIPVKCMDIMEADLPPKQVEDPKAYGTPPGIVISRPPVTKSGAALGTSNENSADAVHEEEEGQAVSSKTQQSASSTAGTNMPEKGQKHKQAAPEAAPLRVTGTDRVFMDDNSPRPPAVLLFLSVSLAAILLLMKRLRRRIS